MARLDRAGSFWGRKAPLGTEKWPYRADIAGFHLNLIGELPGLRRTTREADLSTQ
jgi:hypothetical protein